MESSTPVRSGTDQDDVTLELHKVANVVHEEFDAHLDPRTVDECLQKVAAQFDDASVRAFIPLLVGRYTREELRTRMGQIQ